MDTLVKPLKKRIGGVKTSLLCGAAALFFAGALAFIWPMGGSIEKSTVYGAPCKLGQTPEEDDCDIEELSDCNPQLERCSGEFECTGPDCGFVEKYLNPTINFLAIIVGLVVTISIVVGGIQYSSAGDNPQATAKAKGRIVDSLVALLAFVLLYLGLQWLIPGGLF